MNHKQRVVLADAICAVRPDWDQGGVVSQLHTLDSNWAGTDASLAAHAMAVAANPVARTPGALNAKMPEAARPSSPSGRGVNEPSCAICSRRESDCRRVHELEVRKGFPDPHGFESEEEATARRARAQLDDRLMRAAEVGVTVHTSRDLPYVPPDLLQEAAASSIQEAQT